MAKDIVVITGRFPIEEINKCLSTSGYIVKFYNDLMSGKIKESKPKFN
ncbi:hypothetical protein GW796_09725 [archaeon]|nr:hypothetical protein [archaeon]